MTDATIASAGDGFISDEELEVFEPQGEVGEGVPRRPTRPDGPPLEAAPVLPDVLLLTAGGCGHKMGEAIRALVAATGQGIVAGCTDLVHIQPAPPFISPLPGRSFPDPDYLVFSGDDSLVRARRLYGQRAWEREMCGVPVADQSVARAGSSIGDGGAGWPSIGRAVYRAEARRTMAWMRRLLQRLLRRDQQDGVARGLAAWNGGRAQQLRLRLIVCMGSAGCCGRTVGIPLLSEIHELARELGFSVDPYLVVVGGKPYGEATAPVHERIAANARSWLDEVDEVVLRNRVRIGPGHIELMPPALLPPGRILYFNDDITDDAGQISDQARENYLVLAGLTAGTAILSGALQDANEIGINNMAARDVIRRVRLVGDVIDRGELARRLAATRSERLRQALLDAIGTSAA